MSVDPVMALIARAALVVLFAAAAWHKWRNLAGFEAALANYQVLPGAIVPAAARGVVVLEIALVMALILARFDPYGGGAAALLLGLYSAAIALNLRRGRRDIDCGCLGPGRRQPLSGWLLARNGLLVLAALVLVAPVGSRPLHDVDAVSAAGALTTLVLLWHAAHRLGDGGLGDSAPILRRPT